LLTHYIEARGALAGVDVAAMNEAQPKEPFAGTPQLPEDDSNGCGGSDFPL